MKNKEITLHELMGLMKDGKAPKKIKLQDTIYEYDKNINGYFDKNGYNLFYLVMSKYILDSKIEILSEENNEWEDIEEINNSADDTLFTMECYTGIPEKAQDWNFGIIKDKINQLIKNQRKIIEILKNKD